METPLFALRSPSKEITRRAGALFAVLGLLAACNPERPGLDPNQTIPPASPPEVTDVCDDLSGMREVLGGGPDDVKLAEIDRQAASLAAALEASGLREEQYKNVDRVIISAGNTTSQLLQDSDPVAASNQLDITQGAATAAFYSLDCPSPQPMGKD